MSKYRQPAKHPTHQDAVLLLQHGHHAAAIQVDGELCQLRWSEDDEMTITFVSAPQCFMLISLVKEGASFFYQ